MKHRLILCRSCGQKNQVPLDEWRADCGRCEKRLPIPDAMGKMLKARAPAMVSAMTAVLVLGLLVSGVMEMWSGAEPASADEPGLSLSNAIEAG